VTDAPEGAPRPPKPEIKVLPPKSIVKTLSVNQEVVGRVRRLADFGAFIDIGVGTDGLVHVSEISPKRINKPSDVLRLGQQVTAWIKELDKEHNRISLTMIAPETPTLRNLSPGDVVTGRVTRIENYGIFVDVGVGYDGMVHVKEMTHGYVKHPGDLVKIGDEVQAKVIDVRRRRGQIDLSMRALLPEPAPEPKPEPIPRPAAKAAPAAVVVEAQDDLSEEEEESLPTSFEFALQRAQFEPGGKGKKRNKKQWYSGDEDDDIVSRTLMFTKE
jgi:transcriptional accessory protein Tex/SPT6